MPELVALAKKVKSLRKELNETQLVFGLNCGLSEDVISQLENQRTNPKLSTLQNIAAYTNVTVSDLLKTEE